MVRKLYRGPAQYHGDYQILRYAALDAGLSYVDLNQPYPSFRNDAEGSWWLVEFGLQLKTIDGPPIKDWGRVSLRVRNDGIVCRIVPTGEREGEASQQRNIYSKCLPGSQRPIRL